MNNHYGPWATAINVGPNPRMSAFWRTRLTMLVPAGQASAVLSWRSVVMLGAMAVLLIALPTVSTVPAAADENAAATAITPTDNAKSSEAKETSNKASAMAGRATFGGPIEPSPSWSSSPKDRDPLDFPFYEPLHSSRKRKQLNLSAEQEAKLHELSRRYQVELKHDVKTLWKQEQTLPPEKKQTEGGQIAAQVREKVKPLRNEVEALLTAEQLDRLRNLTICTQFSPLPLVSESRNNLTEDQKAALGQLYRLENRFNQQVHAKILRAERANDDDVIAVLTPEQIQGFERELDEESFGRAIIFGEPLHANFTSPPGVGHVTYPVLWEIREELRLTEEQMARLNTMFMESKVSQAMYKLSGKDLKSQTIGASASTGGSLAPVEKKPPQVQQKWEDLKKQLCEQIAEVLTSDQFAALKRFAREQAVARLARKVPFYEGTKVGVSDVQKEKLRQLNNARSDAEHQLFNSVKENTLNAMPPELRQKCFEAEERRGWWW